MKLTLRMAGILVALLLMPTVNRAQEQVKASNDQSISHVRIDLLLTEYDGQKKVSSLPYTIYAESYLQQHHGGPPPGSLRIGVRVPVSIDSNNLQYMDVGTNIDCYPWTFGEGVYDLRVSVNRSSIYAPSQGENEGEQIHAVGGRMITRNFSTDFDLKLHDGETADGTSAADPLNGHILKISVTLHVIK